ncbi:MAG TPA: TonB-dependent receptor [Accumulibacter sp.]|nr:TonB-dependent receptor [Accumulibacter sp.]
MTVFFRSPLHQHLLACALATVSAVCHANEASELPEISLEDLLKVEVTSASRKTEQLHDVAAAVFVISRDDIERSGATSIPEVLRMAPGIEVARLANNRWAVSVRGFNGRFANKLLVLMDGRSMYSPLFSGVLWEYEDTLLEDVDRIEVIRGAGAAMWGSNAVNGVINIITRRARDTQGNLAVAGAGSEERAFAAFRHGGEVGNGHYRVWGKAFVRDGAVTPDDRKGNDYWRNSRVGFRSDWNVSPSQRLMISGAAYSSQTGDRWLLPDVLSPTGASLSDRRQDGQGGHLLSRGEWTLADGSEAVLQTYIDHSRINLQNDLSETRTTVDLDFQHRLTTMGRHDLMWGLGYRQSRDKIETNDTIHITPTKRNISLTSAFIYDDIALLPEKLRLALGARFENNNLSGFEILPNARLMWTPTPTQSIWTSLSRATRTPSRSELDSAIDLQVSPAGTPANPSPFPVLIRYTALGEMLRTESVRAFEIGYRQQFAPSLSLDVAAFHNRYENLRATTTGNQQLFFYPIPYILQNVVPDNSNRARTRGVEIAVDWYPLTWWRLQPSYTYLHVDAWSASGDETSAAFASGVQTSSPRQKFSLRSSMSLSNQQQLDFWLRYIGKMGDSSLSSTVASHTALDLRYAWRPIRNLELSLVGQNLFDRRHVEIVPNMLPSETLEIQRGVYAKARWEF